jgi:hypothetical protein
MPGLSRTSGQHLDRCSGRLGIKCHAVHHVRYGDVACDPREPAVRRSRTLRSNTGSDLLHTRSIGFKRWVDGHGAVFPALCPRETYALASDRQLLREGAWPPIVGDGGLGSTMFDSFRTTCGEHVWRSSLTADHQPRISPTAPSRLWGVDIHPLARSASSAGNIAGLAGRGLWDGHGMVIET